MMRIPEVNRKLKHIKVNHDEGNIFVLGATGSGKSTLICYLNGAKMKWEKVKKKYHHNIRSIGNFPEIGNQFNSCTDIPEAYGNYIDSAGFLDSKGPEQEIINIYATAKLFKRWSKAKIVVVVEWANL